MRRLIILLGVVLLAGPAWAAGPTVGPTCRLVFTPSPDADVVAYDLFVGTGPGTYGPAQRVPLAEIVAAVAPDPSTDRQMTLCQRASLTMAGQYYTTLAAVDGAGNVSALAVEAPFVLDPLSPAAASSLRVR